MPSGARWRASRRTSASRAWTASRCVPCSSVRPGSRRSRRRWRSSPRSRPGRPRVGSSRCGRATCSRRRSTPRSPGTSACTASSSRWSAAFSPEVPGGNAMSGHSKWATTKHKKAVVDAKRGKMFAKLIKNIEVAARTGGGDPAGNPTLYDAIQKAKKSSVPNDNIDRAVKRGSGAEAGGTEYQTIMYEGYAPGGVAVLIECLTDNRNRAAAEVRTALTRNGGALADPGSVSYVFERKGVVIVPKSEKSEDDLLEGGLEAGAEEVNDNGDTWEIVSEATDFVAVRTALQEAGIDYDSAEASWVPTLQVPLDVDGAKKMIRVIEALEDSDDVQDVFANGDIPD